MLSQNVAFAGAAPVHADDEWAPGHGLAIALREQLQRQGWTVSEPDVEEGCWLIACGKDRDQLELALATAGAEWMIQLRPAQVPGWLGRLRGKAASASPASCHALAAAVHAALTASAFSSFRWCWDADPFTGNTTGEPSAPPAEAG